MLPRGGMLLCALLGPDAALAYGMGVSHEDLHLGLTAGVATACAVACAVAWAASNSERHLPIRSAELTSTPSASVASASGFSVSAACS